MITNQQVYNIVFHNGTIPDTDRDYENKEVKNLVIKMKKKLDEYEKARRSLMDKLEFILYPD